MKVWQAILVTILIIIVIRFIPFGIIFAFLIILGSTIWGYKDAKMIGINKHKSFLATKPWHVALGMWLLWIVYFPWYLSFSYKIKRMETTPKEPVKIN